MTKGILTEVVKFLRENPSPSEGQVQSFAIDNDLNYTTVEESIFRLAGMYIKSLDGKSEAGPDNVEQQEE